MDERKIKLSGKGFYPSNPIKYLGTKIDRLAWSSK